MRRLLLPIALALLAAAGARANSQFASSALGIGIGPTHVRGWTMGGLGLALGDTLRLSLANPAGPGGCRRVSMSAVYLADRRRAADPGGEIYFTSSGFPLFEFMIPFGSRVALGFGYDEDADIGTARTRVPFGPDEDPAIPHTRYFERKGALFRVPAVAAFRLFRDVRIGFRLDNYFLNIEEVYDLEFDETSVLPTTERLRIGCSGTGATFGLLVPLPGRAEAGLVYTTSASLDGERERVGASGALVVEPVGIGVPERIGGGASISFGTAWTAGAEASLVRWESVEDTVTSPGGYADAVQYAFGVERAPGRDDPWFLRVPLRAGFRLDPLAYRSSSGSEIAGWSVSAGSGFPLGGGRGVCDFGLEYGRLGDRGEIGLEESYLRVLIGFSGQEPWRRRKSYVE